MANLRWEESADPQREGAILLSAELPAEYEMPDCQVLIQETSVGEWQWMILLPNGHVGRLSDNFSTWAHARTDCEQWLDNP